MKSVVLIHTALLILGGAIGLGATVTHVDTTASDLRLAPSGMCFSALLAYWLARFAFSKEHKLLSYFFWWNYLCAVLSIGLGVSLLARSMLAAEINYLSFSVLLAGVGFMFPLLFLYRSYWPNRDSAH